MIRNASIFDIPRITEMWGKMVQELGLEGKTGSKEEQARFFYDAVLGIKDSFFNIIIIEEDAEVIGFISGIIFYSAAGSQNQIGHCNHIYIEPEKRSKGYEFELVDAMEKWMISYRCNEITFETKYSSKSRLESKGYKPYQITYRKVLGG